MRVSYSVPRTAATAARLLGERYQRSIAELATQAVEDLGLRPDQGWTVNFNDGTVSRQIADGTDGTNEPDASETL